ncbi:peptidoglycan bridge formation glycyltransferase FemA/FemB family protein [Flavobacterium sp. SUN052]|uniref:lipid II:glycine glycyltransferase FemX n=1 Tax=Flavobacterium sp. SUN052 TaxID=3002441 RepID=UPI00237EAE3B|nr:peptidoglycan bridge formation glycyltransferase FemA/FemB family protein [Flavobacterium sp. SUN052]MEC4004392.1 peptidoglycan bridge formation glycyltransferase FemA/FemB family protein [Flavobacterium sp. SUN052]
MTEFFFTKEQKWLDEWDAFLQKSERGLYNQLSDWIKSYEVYGFDYDFFLIKENGTIVGGCSIVIAKFSFFKFYIIPCGPVLSKGFENKIDYIIETLKKDATKRNCCYFQISLPIVNDSRVFSDYTLPTVPNSSIYFSGKSGTKFKYVIPLYGMRLVELLDKNYSQVFDGFSKNHKRNINKSRNENLVFKFVTSSQDIEEGYNCFVLNAQDKGYPLRSFLSMKHTLQTYITKDFAKLGCCFLNDKIVGAIYVMKTGNRFIYINGGVLKNYQDLNCSHYMHDQIIKLSLELGYKSYDVSVGGSEGVIKFKEGFGSELYNFIDTKHWIIKPMTFKIYNFLENILKSHKTKIASILIKIKKFNR